MYMLNDEFLLSKNSLLYGTTAIHGAVEQLHVRVQPLNDEFFAKQKTSLLHSVPPSMAVLNARSVHELNN